MKKYLGIAITVIFFLLLLVLLLFKLLGGNDTSQRDSQATQNVFPSSEPVPATLSDDGSPDTVAEECYRWYIKYYIAVPALSYERLSAEPMAQRCFSASLISSWEGILEISETDPILISQDYQYSWVDSVQARTVSQLSQASSVEVVLGSGIETHTLIAQMERGDSGWRITSIDSGFIGTE